MVTVQGSSAGVYEVGDDGFDFSSESLTDWDDTSDATIIRELQGHSYVLDLYDLTEVMAPYVMDSFTAQSSGVIELYIYFTDITKRGGMDILDESSGLLWRLYVDDSKFYQYSTGSGATEIANLSALLENNKWFHLSVEFNNSGGNEDFRGDGNLADGKGRVYLDGTQSSADYDLEDGDDAGNFKLIAGFGTADSGYHVYYDAVGFSWDATYDIGDNLTLAPDFTFTLANISQMKIHYPTTLEPTNVKFDGKTYEKYFPICVAKINPSEGVFLGGTIKITDNLTSGGATASSVIFKGEVVKKLTKETSGFIPSYLIFSNAKEMDSIKPEGSYTKDTDGYISDILTNLCDKLTEGTLSDGADLGTFTAAGDKSFTLIIKQCARFDGYVAYIDSSAGADNADLMYNDGSTDTGIDIDESSSTLRGLRAISQLDEHINKVIVRGGIQADGTRAEGTASDTTSQGLYGIVPTYDTDTTLNTDALCASKAAQILADNEFGNRRVVLGYKDATKGMLQPGETVTFDWDKDVHDIGFSIEQEQYIIARNVYDPLVGLNILTLFSSIYYPPISDGELLQETSHVALQNSDNIADLQSGQHDRELMPLKFAPKNGDTAGDNNVYWEDGDVAFGKDSQTNNAYVRMYFQLPADYVDGENVTLTVCWLMYAAADTISYQVDAYLLREDTSTFVDQDTGTWSNVTSGKPTFDTVTITGTNLDAGDWLYVILQMEDDNNNNVTYCLGATLTVTVNGRD